VAAVVLDLVRPLLGVGVVVITLVRLGEEVDEGEDPRGHQREQDRHHEGGETEVVQGQEGDAEYEEDHETEHLGPEGPRQGGLGLTRVLATVLRLLLLANDGQLLGGSRVVVPEGQGCGGAACSRDESLGVFVVTRLEHGALSLKSIYRVGAGSADLGAYLTN
jgi:hypothetical protein